MKRLIVLVAIVGAVFAGGFFDDCATAATRSFDPGGGGNTLPTCNASRVGWIAYNMWGTPYICLTNYGSYDWVRIG